MNAFVHALSWAVPSVGPDAGFDVTVDPGAGGGAVGAALTTLVAGAAIAYLAIADRLVGHGDGWAKPFLVAAGINGAPALTGIGALVSFAVGAAGFGAIPRDYLA